MRFRLGLVALLVTAVFSFLVVVSAAQSADGGRPPMFTPQPTPPVSSTAPTTPTVKPAYNPKQSASLPPVSLFGMNLYLTGLERSESQSRTLGALAAQGGVKWSREELSWANLEPQSKGNYNWAPYDNRLDADFNNNINVVGMLLTTPRWATSNPNAGDWFWNEPSNFNDYYDFVRAAVGRWKNQIHVWEIWNEPNNVNTWKCPNSCNRAAEYARFLQGAYSAVKSVDPGARVLIGGLYVHDTGNEGMAFLNQVISASGGAINFDGLSVHTYMPDRIPESMAPYNVIQNFQYRLNMVNDWINAHGGRPGEIWITEEGRSTCNGCAYHWSEDEQASMLVRMYGIAAATPRVVQFDYFQFEDKFNNPADLYGGMSIVRDDFSPKPAYDAYKTMARQLDGATYVGMGPQMVPGNNPRQPDNSDYVGFDYHFTRGTTDINLMWRVNNSVTLNYPVSTAQVDVVDRDGNSTRVTATNGSIPLTISPRPVYVVGVPVTISCQARFNDVCSGSTYHPYVECMASRGILSGYPDGTFHPEWSVTRGQLAKIVSAAAGYTDLPTTQTFQDVPPGSTYYPYVERIATRGIIAGYECGGHEPQAGAEPCVGPQNRKYFRLGSNATRGQISKIVSSARGYTDPVSGQTFQDVPPSNIFYVWIMRLSMHGVMSGYQCGGAGEPCVGSGNLNYFRPGLNATRGQVAKIVTNTFFPNCQQ